jgi:hypothetical protein
MNTRSVEDGKSTSSYRQSLCQAMSFFLTGSLFGALSRQAPGWNRNLGWTLRYVIFQCVLMTFDPSVTLKDRFAGARRVLRQMFKGGKAPGKTYQGLVEARRKISGKQRRHLKRHLRECHRRIARDYWSRLGWEAFAVDGSRVETARTQANEQALGCAGRSKTGPQLSLTVLYQMGTGLPWDWQIGRGPRSERDHLSALILTLPQNALLVADAGFVGYDLFQRLLARNLSFLIRVGANVHLLADLLDLTVQIKGDLVFLWPQGKRHLKPLTLRLIKLEKANQSPVYLVTNVLDDKRLPDRTASALYRLRWGVELCFRNFKRTLDQHKMRSHSPEQAKQELFWAMVGYLLMGLMSVDLITAEGRDPRALSAAGALRTIREAMTETKSWRRKGDLRVLLKNAVQDTYVRTGSKKARNWPHKKNDPPAGIPKIRPATEKEKDDAKRSYEKKRVA